MFFYEIPVGIQAIFWYFFLYTEKNTKKLREYHQYFFKKHGITVLSYNYLICCPHDIFNVLCSSTMMNANVNNCKCQQLRMSTIVNNDNVSKHHVVIV